MRRKLLNFRGSKESKQKETAESRRSIDVTDDGLVTPGTLQAEEVVTTGSVFDAVLSKELLVPSVEMAPSPPSPSPAVVDDVVVESAMERDQLRAEMTAQTDSAVAPVPTSAGLTAPGEEMAVDGLFESSPVPPKPVSNPFSGLGFWDRYDEATASAELFSVPPAAITAILGSLMVACEVAERCRTSHWVSDCDVYVMTERPELIPDPSWRVLDRPSDVVALLDDGLSDFPLVVVDIPRELPTWIRPLMSRMRDGGVGLVRYVLGNDPSDEDLATWHGELGRPSVLDLAATVPPARVLDLLDRGEPVVSVGGMPITADLLMAMRLAV